MAIRQVRGVVAPTLAQEDVTVTVHKMFPFPTTTGKVTVSGLVTVPLSRPTLTGGILDPVSREVPLGRLPVGIETREAARLGEGPINGVGFLTIGGLVLLAFTLF